MRSLTILLLIALPTVTSAHHSANEYDQNTVVEIDGIVVDVFWRNPHVVITVASNMDDPDEVWELEGASVSSLGRRGFTRDTVKEGDFVRAAGHPSSRNDALLLLTNVLTPSGDEIIVRRGMPRWQPGTRRRPPSAFDPDRVAQAKAEAEGKAEAVIAAAEGKAKSITLESTAQAEANKRIADSLTGEGGQLLLRRLYLEEWDGILPRFLMGGGSDGMSVILPPEVVNAK